MHIRLGEYRSQRTFFIARTEHSRRFGHRTPSILRRKQRNPEDAAGSLLENEKERIHFTTMVRKNLSK
jgi:hypothetical protein